MAANQFACDVLGYTREELLRLTVNDVAKNGERDYQDMVKRSRWEGPSTLTRKDGSTVEMRFTARETRVAGMAVYVSVGWPATE